MKLLSAADGYSTVPMPDVGKLRLLRRRQAIEVSGGPAVKATLGVGTPLSSVSRAQEGVARAFILAGALAFVVALVGALLIGTRDRPTRCDGWRRSRRRSRPATSSRAWTAPNTRHARCASSRTRSTTCWTASRVAFAGPARVRRRRLARAPHAPDRDPGPARGARIAGAPEPGGGAACRASS